MENDTRHPYTISDLEARTGINRRTIHFYVKEGVLPAPQGTGGGARYGEEHLLRLQLTRELQKSHLKLSGIREALDGMTEGQMRDMARKAGSAVRTWDSRALGEWLETRLRQALEPAPPCSQPSSVPPPETCGTPAREPWNRSLLDLVGAVAPPAATPPATPAPRVDTPPQADETWQRVRIADGFEVLLRADVADAYRQIVKQMADRVSGPCNRKEK